MDVAGYVTTLPGSRKVDRYAALWTEQFTPLEQNRMYVAASPNDYAAAVKEFSRPTSLLSQCR